MDNRVILAFTLDEMLAMISDTGKGILQANVCLKTEIRKSTELIICKNRDKILND